MIETLTLDDIWLMGESTWRAYSKQIKKYGPSLMVVVACVGVYGLFHYLRKESYINQAGNIAESHPFNPQGLPSDLKFNEKEKHCALLHTKMINNSHRLNFAPSKAEHNRLKREIDLMKVSKEEQNCRT